MTQEDEVVQHGGETYDDTYIQQGMEKEVGPRAAPDPPSTPGLPVPAAAGPALTPPAPPSTPGAPVQSWLVPPPA